MLERWRDELPALSGLMERGTYGRLTSVIPPITVPAWSCMMSSKTPVAASPAASLLTGSSLLLDAGWTAQ